MGNMKAFRLVEWGKPGQYVDVPIPEPGYNDVLIRIKAVGLCRSDLHLLDSQPGSLPFARYFDAGFTLGHENAGYVEKLGEGVTDLKKGESVVIHHISHCSVCEFCISGVEQHCEAFKSGGTLTTRGVGLDGGLAQYIVVPRTEVISIGTGDPVLYAPLTDAGVTAYHAVQTIAQRLRPGSTAAVIGVGGLGSYAVQLLKILSPARVFAIDVAEQNLKLAIDLGADETVKSDNEAAERIMNLTNGKGIDGILDFVGSDQTLLLATKVSRPLGRIAVVGMSGGSVNIGWELLAPGCEFTLSLASTRKDLSLVCKLAEDGKLQIDIQKFSFDQIEAAYDLLRAGTLTGRAVIVFD